jgi:transcription-repair coupling factor (superfamily II helicase)
MFLRLMENAIAELKGETPLEPLDPEINVRMSAVLSESYIPDIDQRMVAYRRLAKMTELSEIADFKNELIDRYGKPPAEANNLLFKIVLKILSKKAGIARLDLTERQLNLQFSEAHLKNAEALVDMIQTAPHRYELTPGGVLKAKLAKDPGGSHRLQAKNLLKEIIERVNN